jgi:RNA polymerase sigma factor (sigma-70 family)
MKKHRKQLVKVLGKRQFVDVPVDDELYKADNRAEYQRTRSKAKHVPLSDIVADLTGDVFEAYENAQLLEALKIALCKLPEHDRKLIEHIYYDGLTEHEVAEILNVSQQTVNKKKHRAISKLRIILVDWF